jgi:hypothetical protein
MFILGGVGAVFGLLLLLILASIYSIGPTQIGLVRKRIGRKLPDDNPVALKGEAGYQAELLMPGLRFKFILIYAVTKHSWIQVPAGQIGVVIAQMGDSLPIGAKSAIYKNVFGNFSNLQVFLTNNGQKGVQRPVLPPGTLLPIHPVAFLVITKSKVYGIPVSKEYLSQSKDESLSFRAFGLEESQLEVTLIEPVASQSGKIIDMVGVVTTLDGQPLPPGDIASRLGGYDDVHALEQSGANNSKMIEVILGSKNDQHNAYQDFQVFLSLGGRIGLQHDPLLYGAYTLNPFLVRVEKVPMLVVEQGEVAVVKSYVGLPTEDTSGSEFKFGSLVRPGHRGIWEEPLRTGKYPINPRIYQPEIVPTCILTLNWAEMVSKAHNLDSNLQQIVAKSSEGFVFKIDLQVQIHVPDTKAPRVISSVGTMQNLVNEVLQAAVGNHFRDKLQSMPAVRFIETRQRVQEEAFEHISFKLAEYQVETKGVYIQDVILPEKLVDVLTQREIANQEIATFKKQEEAQQQRIAMEKTKGQADMQTDLAKSEVNIQIEKNRADARKAQADGEATYLEKTGAAKGVEVRSVGMARAEAYEKQVNALGPQATALVNTVTVLAEKGLKFVPEIMVLGGQSGSQEGLAATLMGYVGTLLPGAKEKIVATPEPEDLKKKK